MPSPIPSVHLIDDDPTVLKSLVFSVASAGYPSRAFASAEEFLAQPRDPAACIVVDVRLPGVSGVGLVRRLKSEGHVGAIIVMTGHADVTLAVEAMKAGAVEFLQKPFRPADLIQAIEEATARGGGGRPICVSGDVLQRLRSLTTRQRQVLSGIVEGKLNKVIAHELGLSVRTVEGYRAAIMSKTGAKSVSELVRIALAAGLVSAA
ncbi:MAG: response regulator transcription factor [Pseudomonadota bacterium]